MELDKALKQLNKHIKKIPVIYHINKDKGVVVAKLDIENGVAWLNRLWNNYVQVCLALKGTPLKDNRDYPKDEVALYLKVMDDDRKAWKARGIAKCSPEDVYNEKTGKLIAKKKLQYKFYSLLHRVFVKNYNSLVNYLDANLQVIDYFTFKGLKNAEDIFLIGGGSEEEWQKIIDSAKGHLKHLNN